MDGDLLAEPFERVLSLQLLQLDWSVLIQELVQRQVSAAHTNLDIVLLYLDSDPLGTELVDAFGLAHKHDFKLGSLGIVVDELCELAVDHVVFHGDVDGYSLLQINDVLLQRLDFNLGVLQLLQQFQTDLVTLVHFLLHLDDVVRCILKFVLQLCFLLHEYLHVRAQCRVLILQLVDFLLLNPVLLFLYLDFLLLNLEFFVLNFKFLLLCHADLL